jgi:hypothetical protein
MGQSEQCTPSEAGTVVQKAVLQTRAKNILFKSSAMTLNYELEEEPPKGGLDASARLSLLSASNRGTW